MGGKISGRTKKALAGKIRAAEKIAFFLDYDGTLAPIRKKPDLAKITRSSKSLLKKLSRKKWAEIFILSGRRLRDVKAMVGVKSLFYIGNHGMEMNGPGLDFIHPKAKVFRPLIKKCRKEMQKAISACMGNPKGVILENKHFTLSLHYRTADTKKIPLIKKVFWDTIRGLRGKGKINITRGKKVLEVRPRIKWDKGESVKWILKSPLFPKTKTKKILPLCIGDDMTDEDAFRALGKQGASILVSRKKRKTAARYRLSSPGEVTKFLNWILSVKQ